MISIVQTLIPTNPEFIAYLHYQLSVHGLVSIAVMAIPAFFAVLVFLKHEEPLYGFLFSAAAIACFGGVNSGHFMYMSEAARLDKAGVIADLILIFEVLAVIDLVALVAYLISKLIRGKYSIIDTIALLTVSVVASLIILFLGFAMIASQGIH